MLLSRFLTRSLILGLMLNFTIPRESSLSNNFEEIDREINADLNTRDKWLTDFTDMPTPRYGLSAQFVDGKVYCIGGYNGSIIDTVEIYDPVSDTWTTGASIPTAKSYFASSVVDGKIYCIGGSTNSQVYVNTVDIYDPSTNTWTAGAPMPTARNFLTANSIDGKIYCIGGDIGGIVVDTVEIYDTETNTWTTGEPMPTPRFTLKSEVVGGKIYSIGGHNGDIRDEVEIYNPTTNTWTTGEPMPTPRSNFTLSAIGDNLYAIGGYNESNKVEIYNTKNNQWKSGSDMSTPRTYLSSVSINDKIYCIGGHDGDNSGKVDVYIPHLPSYSSNIDVYIKPESILSLSMPTNSVSFEGFSSIEDVVLKNAIVLNINSSAPYEINAQMMSEIQNHDGTEIIDKSILNIKADADTEYKTFNSLSTPIRLFDMPETNGEKTHTIDLMLNSNIPYKVDNYKTTIKFEVNQK